MTREEFFEWLNEYPSHKWEVITDEYGYVRIAFKIEEEDKEE